MWHAITDFLLKAHASGLSHEAVIEIMIALLAVMIAVLTLISGLFAVAVTVVGIFGYQTIRDEAAKRADISARKTAARTARTTAKKIASAVMDQIWSEVQASGMSEAQSESDEKFSANLASGKGDSRVVVHKRRKATSDANLKERNEK